MAVGTSLLLIAIGAVLRFAVHVTTHGFNLHTIGVILIVVGIVGLVISLLWMSAWSRRDRVVASDRAVPANRATPAERGYRDVPPSPAA